MSAIEKAKWDLKRAMLTELAERPEQVTVTLYRQDASVDLVFTAEAVRAAAERQLAALPKDKS